MFCENVTSPPDHNKRMPYSAGDVMKIVRKFLSALAITAAACSLSVSQSVRDYRRAHERQIIEEFTQLLAIPNVASDRENNRRNAEFIFGMMQRRGLNP